MLSSGDRTGEGMHIYSYRLVVLSLLYFPNLMGDGNLVRELGDENLVRELGDELLWVYDYSLLRVMKISGHE